MTKEEMIKEAWGLNYEDFSEHIDSDGWAIYPHFQKHEMVEDVRPLEFKEKGSGFRPKTLQGIENNNGWIKIESKDDLPKDGHYWVITKDGILTDSPKSDDLFQDNNYWLSNITHYQPIIKPKPPIY